MNDCKSPFDYQKSRSALFKEAIQFAQRLPNYQISNEVFSVELTTGQAFSNWDNFSRLHNIATRFTSCRIYFDGELIMPYDHRFFYALQDIYSCALKEKIHHCSTDRKPGWGCAKINRIKRHIEYASCVYWYHYGQFSRDFTYWIIDKELIMNRISQDIEDNHISECPFFEINRVKKAVWSLPGSIVIDNINWEIVYKEDFIGDKVAKIPDSIRHKDNSEIVYPELPFKEKTIDEMTNEEIDKLIEEKMRNAKGKSNSNP